MPTELECKRHNALHIGSPRNHRRFALALIDDVDHGSTAYQIGHHRFRWGVSREAAELANIQTITQTYHDSTASSPGCLQQLLGDLRRELTVCAFAVLAVIGNTKQGYLYS